MQVKSFHPIILTPNPERVIKVYEDMGFTRRHAPIIETPDEDIELVQLRNGDHYVDVAGISELKQDKVIIRINVDNFEETYEMLLDHGFKNFKGDTTLYTETTKTSVLISPSGFGIGLVKNIKWKL